VYGYEKVLRGHDQQAHHAGSMLSEAHSGLYYVAYQPGGHAITFWTTADSRLLRTLELSRHGWGNYPDAKLALVDDTHSRVLLVSNSFLDLVPIPDDVPSASR
jgi:hypothetical protein